MKAARRKRKPPVAPPPPPPPRLLGPGVALVVLALAAFAPALRNGYVNFDDGTYIIVNKTLYDDDGLKRIWFGSKGQMYYPLVFTSFRLERQLEQRLGIIGEGEPPSPRINHGINIFLHAIAGILLWRCLVRLGLGGGLAWFAAAIWLVHPLQTESVVWAVERKNTLAGLFSFAAVLAYLRALAGWNDGRVVGGVLVYLGGVFLFLCALWSKSAFLLLPVTLLLCEWLRGRSLTLAAVGRVLPFLAVALGFAAITVRGEHQAIIADIPPFAARLAVAGMAVWFYLGKLLWPVGAAVIYPRWDVSVTALTLLPLALACVGGVLWVVSAARRSLRRSAARDGVLVALAHYVATLGPALGLIPFGYMELSYVANHFLYVPLAGPIALVALGLDALRRRLGLGRAGIVAAAALLAALGGYSFARSLPWKDTITLANDILEKNPNSARAHVVLGLELQALRPNDPGALAEAITHLRQAVALRPRLLRPHQALAMLLIQAGRYAEAAPELVAALECAPQAEAEVWKQVRLLVRRRAFREVITVCDGLLALKPRSVDALLVRGRCYLQLGERAAAERDFEAALAIAPQYRAALERLQRRATSQPGPVRVPHP